MASALAKLLNCSLYLPSLDPRGLNCLGQSSSTNPIRFNHDIEEVLNGLYNKFESEVLNEGARQESSPHEMAT